MIGVAIVPGEETTRNFRRYLAIMGFRDGMRWGWRFLKAKVLDLLSRFIPVRGVYSVSQVFQRRGVRIYRPRDVNSGKFLRALRALSPDLIVSVAAPQRFRKPILNLPLRGCINIHGSLLPKYRGIFPSFWVLAKGERETGVTVHYMTEGIDEGPIILQRKIPISPNETVDSLLKKSKWRVGPEVLVEAIDRIAEGKAEVKEPDLKQGSYFSFPALEDIKEFRRRGGRFL